MGKTCAMRADTGLIQAVRDLSGRGGQTQFMSHFRALVLLVPLVVAAAFSAIPPALADDGPGDDDRCGELEDHDFALRALQDDLILPLSKILAEIEPALGSVVIEIEFECEDNGYVYELKIRTPSGRILEILVDATTGAILEIED